MRKLNDLKALGVAWAEKTLAEDELAAWRKIQDANARIALKRWGERALKPRGDRPFCPCGKISYPTKRDAILAVEESGEAMRAYVCPLGHPVYHLKSSGRSTREDDRR